jgi:hypothetical protein
MTDLGEQPTRRISPVPLEPERVTITPDPGDLWYVSEVIERFDSPISYRLAGHGSRPTLGIETFCRDRSNEDLYQLRAALAAVMQTVEDAMEDRGMFARITPPREALP